MVSCRKENRTPRVLRICPSIYSLSHYNLLKFLVIITMTPATILNAIFKTNTTVLNANVNTVMTVRATNGNLLSSSALAFFAFFSDFVSFALVYLSCPYHSPSSMSLSKLPCALSLRVVVVLLRLEANFFSPLPESGGRDFPPMP